MRMEYEAAPTARTRSLLPFLLISGIAFIAGIAAMAWLVTSWSGAGRYLGIRQEPQQVVRTVPVRVPTAPAATSAGQEQRLVIDPETTRRVNLLEQRVAQIDQQSRSAVGNADRAEGLLVAFAARRALDRGVGLGYIEGLLRQRFGQTQPAAVATVITASREPVTLEHLQETLQEVGPNLTGIGPNRSWWTAMRHELSGLVTVRKTGSPSTMPAERLERVQRRLDAGQVDVALAEVLRMPGRENATPWINDARRYVSARRALDTLETAALLEPRNPALTAMVPPPRAGTSQR